MAAKDKMDSRLATLRSAYSAEGYEGGSFRYVARGAGMTTTIIMPDEAKSLPAAPERAAASARNPSGGSRLRKLLGMSSTFLTVAVLTVLLWVLADQSQLLDQEMPLALTLATEAESDLILMSVMDDSGQEAPESGGGGKRLRIQATFQGSRSRLGELQGDLQSGRLELLAYLSARTYLAGVHKNISVAELLNANDDLRDRGVRVIEAEPAHITVVLEEWVLLPKVKLVLKDTEQSQSFEVYIDPPEIAVEVPSSFTEVQPKVLVVELGAIPEKISADMKMTGTVAKEIEGQPVRPEQAKVTVVLKPLEQGTAKLGPLQIEVAAAPEIFRRYELQFQDEASKVVEVAVVGPPAELEKLQADPKRVWAYIRLSSKHAKETDAYFQVTVKFQFSDVHGVELAEPNPTVKVRLKRKPTGS